MKRKEIVSADDLAGLKFYQCVSLTREQKDFDVLIIGGSYAGLSAAIILARALKQVLIIDGGNPCYIQNSYPNKLITQYGDAPEAIAARAKDQVLKYRNVKFLKDMVEKVARKEEGFFIETKRRERFTAKKVLFATGVIDIMPAITGFKECWGISVLHCANCHGYEFSNTNIGILSNGNMAYEMVKLISNWTKKLAVFTNGIPTFGKEQKIKIAEKNIPVIETPITELEHKNGQIRNIIFNNDSSYNLDAIFTAVPFTQASRIAKEQLGCRLKDGLLQTDANQCTTIAGVYAAGDNSNTERSVSLAIAAGSVAGTCISKKLTEEQF